MKTYIIYCDESIKKGTYYSNFYGAALIDARYYDEVVQALNDKKITLNLLGEIKWTKMTSQYLDKYKEFIELYFNYIKQGKLKIRIMFKHEYFQSVGLTQEQIRNEFYMLYYQFFKHAFGLQYCNELREKINLRIYFDKLPNTNEQNEEFKEYIYGLQLTNEFTASNIIIRKEDITDVDSHKHVILQGMDIILGAMQFRLNNQHLQKDPDTGKRGKKTIAKEKLYKTIHSYITDIYPNFNIGISTGIKGDITNRWKHPYRHWEFISNNYVVNEEKSKNK
jgi:hypothetical protein